MSRKPLILGALSIVLASLELIFCAVLLMVARLTRPVSAAAGDLHRLAEQASRARVAWFPLIEPWPYLVMAIVLLVIGVGLVHRQGWSRRAAMTWAWIALAVLAADIITVFGYVRPHIAAAREAFYASRGLAAPAGVPTGHVGTAALTLCQTAFVLTLLVLLGRRSAATEFVTPPTNGRVEPK